MTGVTNSSGIAPKIIYDDCYSGTLRLSGAEDYVFGGAGNNVIVAGRGVATVFAGAGNDTVTGGALPDTLDGGVGNDLLNGAGGVDILVGDAGNDRLIGGLHNDVLDGGIGNDRLDGQDGNDLLIGGLGQDTMIGGRGADRFDFNSLRESIRGVARDVIYFQHAERDRLDLSTIDADTDGTAGNQAFKFIGASLFSGVDGQLRYSGGVLQGDTNGDKIPDIEIKVVGTLLAVDVIL
jgi:Ca2+-binding RTX toxin-like protein